MPTVGGQDKPLTPSGDPHMSDRHLRSSLIRLASEHPEFRKDLLPLIKSAGCEKLPEGGMRENCEKKKEEGAKKEAAGKLPVEADFRHAYYDMADGLGKTESAIDEDPLLKKDAKLKGLMKALKEADSALSKYMTATYNWD